MHQIGWQRIYPGWKKYRMVEKALILSQFPAVAKAYILYRERRAEARREHGDIPPHVKELVDQSKQYFKITRRICLLSFLLELD